MNKIVLIILFVPVAPIVSIIIVEIVSEKSNKYVMLSDINHPAEANKDRRGGRTIAESL